MPRHASWIDALSDPAHSYRGERCNGEGEPKAPVLGPDLGQGGPRAQQSYHIVGVQKHFRGLLFGVGNGAYDADHSHDQHRRRQNAAADPYDQSADRERYGDGEEGVGRTPFGQPEVETNRNGCGAG